jgi:hypothetical protein
MVSLGALGEDLVLISGEILDFLKVLLNFLACFGVIFLYHCPQVLDRENFEDGIWGFGRDSVFWANAFCHF